MKEPADPFGSSMTPIRSTLRVVGPAVLIAGLAFSAIGIGSFFSAFGGAGPPEYFWCASVGFPLVAVGIGLSKFAFIGPVSLYLAEEVAPVGKDMANYMAEGTKGAVRDVAAAIGEGFRAGEARNVSRRTRCAKCDAENEADARFCKSCGAPLARRLTCPHCHALNDADACFCGACGKTLV